MARGMQANRDAFGIADIKCAGWAVNVIKTKPEEGECATVYAVLRDDPRKSPGAVLRLHMSIW